MMKLFFVITATARSTRTVSPTKNSMIAKLQFPWLCSSICKDEYVVDDDIVKIDAKSRNPEDIMKLLECVYKTVHNNQKTFNQLKGEIYQLREENKMLKKQQRSQQLVIEQLQHHVGNLKQEKLNNKTVFFGIKSRGTSKPCIDIVKKNFTQEDLDMTYMEKITTAYFMKTKNNIDRKPIICVFSNSIDKSDFIRYINKMKREKKIIAVRKKKGNY